MITKKNCHNLVALILSSVVYAVVDDWAIAPVIVGGTGGSGTRGVVSVLRSMGVYMVKWSFIDC